LIKLLKIKYEQKYQIIIYIINNIITLTALINNIITLTALLIIK